MDIETYILQRFYRGGKPVDMLCKSPVALVKLPSEIIASHGRVLDSITPGSLDTLGMRTISKRTIRISRDDSSGKVCVPMSLRRKERGALAWGADCPIVK